MPRGRGLGLVALAVALAAGFALLTGSGSVSPVGRGTPAPPFELQRDDGGSMSLQDLRGRVVLVNFWATWCGPCEDEMPAMERLYRELHREGFELVAISVDTEPEKIAEFRTRLGLSFPILLDPDQDVARTYQTFRFPESLLIGPDGTVLERYVGIREWDSGAYKARIRRLLKGGLPSGPA